MKGAGPWGSLPKLSFPKSVAKTFQATPNAACDRPQISMNVPLSPWGRARSTRGSTPSWRARTRLRGSLVVVVVDRAVQMALVDQKVDGVAAHARITDHMSAKLLRVLGEGCAVIRRSKVDDAVRCGERGERAC
eukprot:6183193-Pleurochrysis_carterae.AAC.2